MLHMVDWTDATPLRLKIAAELAFPNGGMTASGLRREAERGRLVIERIAGKDYTTLAAIADMRKLCEVRPARERPPVPSPFVPNSLGLTESDLAGMRLDAMLERIKHRKAEAKRQRDEEKARTAPERRLRALERRRARARAKYREKKAERKTE
jgi:hypothetical protein